MIFFWLNLVNIYYLEFISRYIKEMLYINTNYKGNQVKEMQLDLHFHLPLILILKNPFFFSSRVKISYLQLFDFSQFYEQIIWK